MRIYDKNGHEQSPAWLYREFGSVQAIVEPGHDRTAYHVAEVHEVDDLQTMGKRRPEAPATLIVAVRDADGAPVEGVDVVFSWPDAPPLPEGGHLRKGVVGATNAEGHAGFAMGPGAYYDPKAAQGPHQVWIYGPGQSPRLAGLGMVAGTNHRHLDVVFQLGDAPEPPPPDPDQIRELLAESNAHLARAGKELRQARGIIARILVMLGI